jgi:hypothetical protein
MYFKFNQLAIAFTMATSVAFSSCKDETEIPIEDNTIEASSSHSIPLEKALSNLKDFLSESGDGRSDNSCPSIGKVFTVKYKDLASRSTSNIIDCEQLLYIANLEGEQGGFAILAADDRSSENILAIIDSGSFSQQDYNNAMSFLNNSENTVFDEYPTDGPGIFNVDEYPDESFINPNTATLYDDDMGEATVGNFTLDDDLDDNQSRSDDNGDRKYDLTIEMCVDFMMDDIMSTDIDYSNSSKVTVTKKYTSWTTAKTTSSILDAFKFWHQDSPFNDMNHKRRKYALFGHQRKAYAGCFPLAIAKLETLYEIPKIVTYEGNYVNWYDLKNNLDSKSGSTSAAVLLRNIVDSCKSLCFYNGTFTFPQNAISYMNKIGFVNAKSYDYNFNDVKEMIDKKQPLIIYAIPEHYNIFKAHSWNIDGYKIKTRSIITTTKNGTKSTTTSEPDSCKMVHCSFGWRNGNYNGYYVSGIFNLNSNQNEYEYITNKRTDNYKHYVHIIKYDKVK